MQNIADGNSDNDWAHTREHVESLIDQTLQDFLLNDMEVTFVCFSDKQILAGYHIHYTCELINTAHKLGFVVFTYGIVRSYGHNFLKVGSLLEQ